MKRFSIAVFVISLSVVVHAQAIKGRVTDSSLAPIANATIEIGNNIVVTTNDEGIFTVGARYDRSVDIKISAFGFLSLKTEVRAGSEIVHYFLTPMHLMLQPVEVTATRAGETAPFTKTNILSRDIAKMNVGYDLPFLLNNTPSVTITSDAGNGIGYTGIRIRGSDATRINMTINGIPYNDAESQGFFFVNLPDFSSSVNSIQIQCGVGTSSNGAGAFGATINFSTNEVKPEPYAEVNNSFGSFNSWKHTIKAGTGIMNKHFTVDARLSKISSDGFIDRAESDLHSFQLSAAYVAEKTSVRLNVISGKEKTYQAWYGISEADLKKSRTINYAGTEKPGIPYDNETDNYSQDHYQLFFNHRFNKHLAVSTAFFLSKGKGYYEQYKANQLYADYNLPDFKQGNDTITSTDLIRQLWLDNDFYGQVFSVQYGKTANQLTIGGGWSTYSGNHYGIITWAAAGIPDHNKWYDHDAQKKDLNLYSKYQRKLNNHLEIFADLQFRQVLYNINGFRTNPVLIIKNSYNFFNPKIGLSYHNKEWKAYASYAVAHKEPNRDDYETAKNDAPKPEILQDYEGGLEYKQSKFNWSATIFYMKYRDQLILSGKINDVGAYTRSNIPTSFRTGIELQAGASLMNWLYAGGNLSLSRNRIKDFTEYIDNYDDAQQKLIPHGTTDISFSPQVVASGNISMVPIKNTNVEIFGKYLSRQFLDNTSNRNRSLDPLFITDIRASYTLKNFLFTESTFIVQVNNVFNKLYQSNGYTFSYQQSGSIVTENYYYPMAGRNFMVAINVNLGP